MNPENRDLIEGSAGAARVVMKAEKSLGCSLAGLFFIRLRELGLRGRRLTFFFNHWAAGSFDKFVRGVINRDAALLACIDSFKLEAESARVFKQ